LRTRKPTGTWPFISSATPITAHVAAFRDARPDAPLVVAASGTDVYPGGEDGPSSRARASFHAASHVVVLQKLAVRSLPAEERHKARVIHQSVDVEALGLELPDRTAGVRSGPLEVCVLAHLRDLKDPLLAARALRSVPRERELRVRLIGRALEPALEREAREEEEREPRFRYLGELPRREALGQLARSDLLLSTSQREGGANAVSEAIALGVAVAATRVDGSVGLLGAGHPGLFPSGDAEALGRLLGDLARDPERLRALRERTLVRAFLVAPGRERECWHRLFHERGLDA